jgi:hypothetical protein
MEQNMYTKNSNKIFNFYFHRERQREREREREGGGGNGMPSMKGANTL